MNTLTLALSLLGLAFAFSPPVQDPKTLSLTAKDGSITSAQVLAADADMATLRVFILGGTMQVKRKLADFTPASVYLIEREAAKPNDFDGHFKMAKRACELGLIGQAGAAARAAVEAANPEEADKKRAEVRAWAADALEKAVRDSIAEKKLADAQHRLKILSTRLNDQRTEEQLDALAAEVDALAQSVREGKEAERQSKRDAQVRQDIDKRLQPIRKNVADGDKLQREAIRKSRNTVQSTNLCEKAIAEYKSAWKALQALVGKHPDDANLAQEAAVLGEQMHDHAIRAALHAANMMTVQGDYKGAMDWTGRILAFDPGNAEALDMQKTITLAAATAASDWGWGWRTAGGPVPVPDPRGQ